MAIIIDPYIVPEKGKVEIRVTAEEAQYQVRWWLRDEISMFLEAAPPLLVVGEQIVWRVSVIFSAPGAGQANVVGAVEVDVVTGEMNATPEHKATIEQQAEEMVKHLPPYQPKGPVPEKYRPKHIPPAPKIIFDEQGLPVVVPANALETDFLP